MEFFFSRFHSTQSWSFKSYHLCNLNRSFTHLHTHTHLPEDVAGKWFIQPGMHVYELKQVKAISMFLHHHLEELLILKHLQHLCRQTN